jgi:hypothetical protein
VDAHREASHGGKLFRGFSFSELDHEEHSTSDLTGLQKLVFLSRSQETRPQWDATGFHQPGLLADCGSRRDVGNLHYRSARRRTLDDTLPNELDAGTANA